MNTQSVLRPETLAEMDASYHAGEYDDLVPVNPSQFDPATDPFGTQYDWLDAPQNTEAESLLSTVSNRTAQEWSKAAAHSIRRIALAGSLAGGTDEQVLSKWIDEGFTALCFSAGSSGEGTLAIVKSQDEAVETRIETLRKWLESEPKFEALSGDERFAIAVAIVDHFADLTP